MPNLKIYVDEAVEAETRSRLASALPSLRDLLCREFKVDISLCQFAIIPVQGLSDQARLSVEIQILAKPERTRDHILAACMELRDVLTDLTQTKAAIRVSAMEPATYVVLR